MSKKEITRMWKKGYPGADIPSSEVESMLLLGWQLGEPPESYEDAEDQQPAADSDAPQVEAEPKPAGGRRRGKWFGKEKDAAEGSEDAGAGESGEGEAGSEAAEGAQE